MGAFLLPLLRGAALVGTGAALGGGFGADGGLIGPPFLGFGEGRPRRRRRRRMLTASDRGDIAFLSATLGKPAAKELAAIRLANLS